MRCRSPWLPRRVFSGAARRPGVARQAAFERARRARGRMASALSLDVGRLSSLPVGLGASVRRERQLRQNATRTGAARASLSARARLHFEGPRAIWLGAHAPTKTLTRAHARCAPGIRQPPFLRRPALAAWSRLV